MSLFRDKVWHKRFHEDRVSLADDERSDTPKRVSNSTVAKVDELIPEDRR